MVKDQAKFPRRTSLAHKSTLPHTLYEEVRRRVQERGLGPHERILDYELAQEFQCTRMPVRQALLRLVYEGYLVATTRGFVAPTLTEKDVRELFEVRRLLEPEAAASTVEKLDADRLGALNDSYVVALAAYDERDVLQLIKATIEFRSIWINAIENNRLRETIQRFVDHAQQVRLGTLTDPGTRKIVVAGMVALLDGFNRRDPAMVRESMKKFIADAERQYFALHSATDLKPEDL
jgi:DNA-binding GntR family transcriptional regulator